MRKIVIQLILLNTIIIGTYGCHTAAPFNDTDTSTDTDSDSDSDGDSDNDTDSDFDC